MSPVRSRLAGLGLIAVAALIAIGGWQVSTVCTIEADGGCLAYRYPDAWLLGMATAALPALAGVFILLRGRRTGSDGP